jgi:hypothetical protein
MTVYLPHQPEYAAQMAAKVNAGRSKNITVAPAPAATKNMITQDRVWDPLTCTWISTAAARAQGAQMYDDGE